MDIIISVNDNKIFVQGKKCNKIENAQYKVIIEFIFNQKVEC